METSLKTGFAQIFSCYPKNLSCPKFGGAAPPLAPPGPYAYAGVHQNVIFRLFNYSPSFYTFLALTSAVTIIYQTQP